MKIKNFVLYQICFLFFLIFSCFLSGCSSETTEGEFIYSHTIFSPYVYLVKHTGNDAIITVPAFVGNYKVWGVKSGAFKDLPNVTEITFLSDNPLSFSRNAFDNCPNLINVNTKWTKPFKGAFKDCSNIRIQ